MLVSVYVVDQAAGQFLSLAGFTWRRCSRSYSKAFPENFALWSLVLVSFMYN